MSVKIELRVERGSEPGRVFTLPTVGDSFLGRSNTCAVPIAGGKISRQHAKLYVLEQTVWVEDLGSRNGTAVNGRRIEGPTPLSPGDQIRIGRTWLAFCPGEAADPLHLLRSDFSVQEQAPVDYLLYRATQIELDRPVALAVFPRAGEPDQRAPLLAMLKARAQLDHRNLQSLLDYGIREERVGYFAAEWIDGPSLARRISAEPPAPTEVLRWGAALADALAQVHAQGAVHGDIGPHSIRLDGDRPVLTEIGLHHVLGTRELDCRAPEGAGQPAADLFALAAVLCSALLGDNPLLEPVAGELEGTLAQPGASDRARRRQVDLRALQAGLRRRVSQQVARELAAGLSPDPAERPSALALAETLRSAARRARAELTPLAMGQLLVRRLLASTVASWVAFPLLAVLLLWVASSVLA